jgi:raffinose/stachyose/melibiose transport system substrate-binding protein
MKKLLTLALALALILSAMPIFASAEANSDDALSIHYISARSATESAILALQKIADEYKQTHPNFNLEIENISDRTSYLQKIKILASSGELPDWFDADPESFFTSLVDEGLVYDMQKLYDELGVSDKFFNISKEYAKLNDGRLNLFTWQCNTEFFFYNKDLFKKAGIESTPTTFDELLADCDKLQAAGIVPITMGGAASWPILRYSAFLPFRMTGNDYIVNACAGKDSFGTDAGLKSADFIQKIAKYFQPGWSTADYDTMVDLFVSQQAAILYNGTWVVQSLVDENKNLFPYIGYFKMPTYTDGDVTKADDYFANSGIGTAVLTKSMTPAMKDFMKFFFDNYADVALNDFNLLPSIKPSKTDGLPQIYLDIIDAASKVNTYAKCWDVVIDSASLDTLNKETMNLALGTDTPQQFTDAMDAVIKENVKQ